jgi:hypothetical protein
MLHQPASRTVTPGLIEPDTSEPVDRSMDILQYATAFLALVVVVMLAVLR